MLTIDIREGDIVSMSGTDMDGTWHDNLVGEVATVWTFRLNDLGIEPIFWQNEKVENQESDVIRITSA